MGSWPWTARHTAAMQMLAIVREAYGPPEALELREVPVPAVGDDDVLVRLHAASLNAADLDYLYGRPGFARPLYGWRRPRDRGLGLDAAGTVEAVGSAVTTFAPGDRVFADLTNYGAGAFAEMAVAPDRAWAPIPDDVPMEIAATLPQSAILALDGLRGGTGLRPGSRVLVNGASGNIGPFAVQIAKATGAHVTGVCRTSKVDFVRELGVDEVIDYTKTDVTRGHEGYDWILDAVGSHPLRSWRRILNPGGRYVMVGGPGGRIVSALLLGTVLSVIGSRKMGLMIWWRPFAPTAVARVLELLQTGTIHPVIDRRYPLAEVPAALRHLDDGQARGKVVITF